MRQGRRQWESRDAKRHALEAASERASKQSAPTRYWLNHEDERLFAHARDPSHAMDILPSSRSVRIELDGELLAETSRSRLLFEGTLLPLRAYILPREDVRVPVHASAKRTWCADKEQASYWSAEVAGETVADLAWSYEAPLGAATDITGLLAFFNERVDLLLDGEPLQRPVTPWS
jgi:uncharacterized protein (DUF427 family)